MFNRKPSPARSIVQLPMQPIPYSFFPVKPAQAVIDTPVWRNGKSNEARWSGELLLSIEALTPLLVGNHQKKEDSKQSYSQVVPQMSEDGRVLLAGSSLKGMLRSTLSNLLQAPMSLVSEHHYTYRPNLGFGSEKEVRAAVITDIVGEGNTATVSIQLLPQNTPVVFIRRAAAKVLNAKPGEHLTGNYPVRLSGGALRKRLDPSGNVSEKLDHYYFSYVGGLDGEGAIAKAFNEKRDVYRSVLVEKDAYAEAKKLKIPEKVLTAYYNTQKILADDKHGHLSAGHPLKSKLKNLEQVKRAIESHAVLNINQLIYIEIEHGKTVTGKPGLRITSMGHHFQYRWAYSSSVRYKNRLTDLQGKLRPELALHDKENGTPQQLTGARLLFGYAIDGTNSEYSQLAQKHFKRLAGRISFNTAIEDIQNKTLAQRFVNAGAEIRLGVLGMPRPSAVEFYLQQNLSTTQSKPKLKKLVTYGDLPSDAGGDLAGRKFYRHQSAAAQRKSYARVDKKTGKDTDQESQEPGMSVRYLSEVGSVFLCTLRFDSLRPWELGALLACLAPEQLLKKFNLPPSAKGYAHKLGYAKPLGLGSIRFNIDKARWRENDHWDWTVASNTSDSSWQKLQHESLTAFHDKLLESYLGQDAESECKKHVQTWSKPLRWQPLSLAAYPQNDGNIYSFHSKLRKAHAKARRGEDVSLEFNELCELLTEPKE